MSAPDSSESKSKFYFDSLGDEEKADWKRIEKKILEFNFPPTKCICEACMEKSNESKT